MEANVIATIHCHEPRQRDLCQSLGANLQKADAEYESIDFKSHWHISYGDG